MNHIRKILGIFILLILLVSMIYCNENFEKNDPHIKKYEEIFENPNLYNNTEISFRAEILAIDKINRTIYVSIQEEPYTYPHVKINAGNFVISNLKKGDIIDVITIFHGKNQMTLINIWQDEPWKTNLIFLRSLPAIPLVFYLFFRTWKFNFVNWRFQRRKKNA